MLRPAQPRLGKNRRIQNSLLPPPGPLVTWAPSLSSSLSSASLPPSSLSSKLNEVSEKKPMRVLLSLQCGLVTFVQGQLVKLVLHHLKLRLLLEAVPPEAGLRQAAVRGIHGPQPRRTGRPRRRPRLVTCLICGLQLSGLVNLSLCFNLLLDFLNLLILSILPVF